ncbi:MAG: hypothetical protein RR334_00800 [Clostridia bacterium]
MQLAENTKVRMKNILLQDKLMGKARYIEIIKNELSNTLSNFMSLSNSIVLDMSIDNTSGKYRIVVCVEATHLKNVLL